MSDWIYISRRYRNAGYTPRKINEISKILPSHFSTTQMKPKVNLQFLRQVLSFFFKLLNEFYYIYRCKMIIITKFYSISIPNPQCTPHPPNQDRLFLTPKSIFLPFPPPPSLSLSLSHTHTHNLPIILISKWTNYCFWVIASLQNG